MKNGEVPPRYYTGTTAHLAERHAAHNAGCSVPANNRPWSVDVPVIGRVRGRATRFGLRTLSEVRVGRGLRLFGICDSGSHLISVRVVWAPSPSPLRHMAAAQAFNFGGAPPSARSKLASSVLLKDA